MWFTLVLIALVVGWFLYNLSIILKVSEEDLRAGRVEWWFMIIIVTPLRMMFDIFMIASKVSYLADWLKTSVPPKPKKKTPAKEPAASL